MQKIKVIIGASYGDEGKGLATDFFGAQGKEKNGTINVLTNGGPQRGHTVELPDGRRHVFKHFGAATFRGAVTYFAEQFLVNPMEFLREYERRTRQNRPNAHCLHAPRLPVYDSLGHADQPDAAGNAGTPQQLRLRDLGDRAPLPARLRNSLFSLHIHEP